MNAAKFQKIAGQAYLRFSDTAGFLRSPLLLGIRVFWGWQFFVTGRGKLLDLSQPAAFFKELGIPFPAFSAAMAGTTECLGGLLLIIGLGSRLTAVPLIVTMTVAYLTADAEAVRTIFSEPDNFVSAAPFLFLLASLLILAFGPGKFSADHFLARRFRETEPFLRKCG